MGALLMGAGDWLVYGEGRGELALKLKDVIARKAKAQQIAGLKQGDEFPVLLNSTKREPLHTRKELAKAAEVSQDSIRKVETVATSAPEPVKAKAREGLKQGDAAPVVAHVPHRENGALTPARARKRRRFVTM